MGVCATTQNTLSSSTFDKHHIPPYPISPSSINYPSTIACSLKSFRHCYQFCVPDTHLGNKLWSTMPPAAAFSGETNTIVDAVLPYATGVNVLQYPEKLKDTHQPATIKNMLIFFGPSVRSARTYCSRKLRCRWPGRKFLRRITRAGPPSCRTITRKDGASQFQSDCAPWLLT